MEVQEKIIAFLSRYFRKHVLAVDEDIFASGVVNSLFAMQLVMFLEQEFQLKVENEDLDLDNFRTIHAIKDFVERKNRVSHEL